MFLIQLMMSFQFGSYATWIELATRMASGHIQIQHHQFEEESRIEYVVSNITELTASLKQETDIVALSPRAEAFVLLSNEEKSFGGLIVGVDPTLEAETSDIPTKLVEGDYLTDEDGAFVGIGIARNLDLQIGSELVIIGSDVDGSVAATVQAVTGIFESKTPIDRALVQIPLSRFQDVFSIPDSAHRLVLMVEDPQELEETLAQVHALTGESLVVKDWHELMPEISHGIQIDIISNAVLQWTLILIIVLSILNTFVMTLFERTREFGMLFAIGMHKGTVFRMIVVESVLLWLIGVAAGAVLTGIVVGMLSQTGIPIPGADQLAERMYMPDRFYPTITWGVALTAPLALGVGSIVASSLASLRIYRIKTAEALRETE